MRPKVFFGIHFFNGSYELKYKKWGCSSVGRASGWHSEGRRFDPVQLHHLQKKGMN